MKRYKTLKVIDLFTGQIGLDDKQAGARSHCLDKVGAGRYEIMGHVQFKSGEVVSFDEAPKVFAAFLECLDSVNDGDELIIEDIMKAIGQLGRENPDHFTGKGDPKVTAISEILGVDITASQRDEAWDRLDVLRGDD